MALSLVLAGCAQPPAAVSEAVPPAQVAPIPAAPVEPVTVMTMTSAQAATPAAPSAAPSAAPAGTEQALAATPPVVAAPVVAAPVVAAPVAAAPVVAASVVAPVPAQAPGVAADAPRVDFFDSEVFDLSMADSLRPKPEAVRVVFAAPTHINAIPHRIDNWLIESRKNGGHISLLDPDHADAKTRSIFGVGIIFDLLGAVEALHDEMVVAERLALVRGYDAVIVYDRTTGNAREVVFKLPHPAPSN